MSEPRTGRAGAHPTPASSSSTTSGGGGSSKLLPVLAAERALRAVILIGIGLILLTHLHTDWADTARHLITRAGLDPSSNETGKLITGLSSVGPEQAVRDGAIALAYGALEAVEGYGLLRRRTWGEYLTILSTALLLIPEVQELTKRPTDLKSSAWSSTSSASPTSSSALFADNAAPTPPPNPRHPENGAAPFRH